MEIPPPDPRDPRDKEDAELTFGDLERLQGSDDPADRERAERLMADHRAEIQEALQGITGRFDETARAFQKSGVIESFGRIGSLVDHLARSQEEERRASADLSRVMAEQAARQAERDARKEEAATATIETVQILEALLAVSNAQQAHMRTMTALLDAMATQSALASQSEDDR